MEAAESITHIAAAIARARAARKVVLPELYRILNLAIPGLRASGLADACVWYAETGSRRWMVILGSQTLRRRIDYLTSVDDIVSEFQPVTSWSGFGNRSVSGVCSVDDTHSLPWTCHPGGLCGKCVPEYLSVLPLPMTSPEDTSKGSQTSIRCCSN